MNQEKNHEKSEHSAVKQPRHNRPSLYRRLTKGVHDLEIWIVFVTGIVTGSGIVGTFLWHFVGAPLDKKLEHLQGAATNIVDRLDQLTTLMNDQYASNGLIAEFRGSSNPVITTSSGEELSLLTDSAHGGISLARYERVLHEPSKGPDGDGFLRIHYYLRTAHGGTPVQPYVGVFAYFANPPRFFNVSKFTALAVKARAETTNGPPCSYFIKLMDSTAARAGGYAWAEAPLELQPANATPPGWSERIHPLTLFKTPQFHTPIVFNPAQVFGFTIVILGKQGAESQGYCDIDDVQFK